MEQKEISLKLDSETKQIICRVLNKHVETLRKKSEGQHTFTKLLIAHEVDRTNFVLNQINNQWSQVLPFTLPSTESGGDGREGVK